jgi:hypothetical protein
MSDQPMIKCIRLDPVRNGYVVTFEYNDYATPDVQVVAYTLEAALAHISNVYSPTEKARNTEDRN